MCVEHLRCQTRTKIILLSSLRIKPRRKTTVTMAAFAALQLCKFLAVFPLDNYLLHWRVRLVTYQVKIH